MRASLLLACLSIGCAAISRPAPGTAPLAGPRPGTPSSPEPGEKVAPLDLGGDGKPDAWTFSRPGPDGKAVVTRKEKDLNGDGKIDTWEKYAPDGTLVRVVYDLDFDGKPDETVFYEKDQLVKKELAFGFDGVPRSWSYYEKGKLVRKERDVNNDGKVDYWEYWENGEVDRIGVDEDGDGQVDRWEAKKSAEAAEGEKPGGEPAQK